MNKKTGEVVRDIFNGIKAIRESWGEFSEYCQDQIQDDVEPMIEDLLVEVRRETSKDICKMIDDIELSEIGSSMEEWREFKHIRNAIRDKYEPEGYQQEVTPPEKEEVGK